MQVGTRDGRIVDVRPAARRAGQQGAPLLEGALRVRLRGRARSDHDADDPRRKDAGDRSPGTRSTAYVAERLRDIVAKHGADAVGVLGSARATNEENYVIQKFARVALGTNNVDCCARVCHAPSAAALKAMLGTGAATNSFDDIERAKTILVCGSNATSCHPIVGARIRQAALPRRQAHRARRAPDGARGRWPTSIWRRRRGPISCSSTPWRTSSSRRAWRTRPSSVTASTALDDFRAARAPLHARAGGADLRRRRRTPSGGRRASTRPNAPRCRSMASVSPSTSREPRR